MTKLTENVSTQAQTSNMIICRHKGNDSMSVDVHKNNVFIEIDNGIDRCVVFDMSMDDAMMFFAAAHFAILIKRDTTIQELEAKLADREQQFNELDVVLTRTRNAFLAAKDYAYLQKDEIKKLKDKVSGLLWQRIQDSEQSRTQRHTIDHLRAGEIANAIESEVDHDAIRTLNQYIIGLEAEISTQKEDSRVLKKVVDTVNDWNHNNVAFSMRQIIDIVDVDSYTQKRDRLAKQKEVSEIVDKWHFNIGDEVVSTDHARRRESIYIEGYVVRIDGDVLLVDVGEHIKAVNFAWMKKVQ